MDSIYQALIKIVGKEHVSNRTEELFIYSFDLGTTEPHRPDYVVTPRKTEEIQEILRLENKEKVQVIPLGVGLSQILREHV